MKRENLKGFTLVELLIVIALIAILSVAVLATLNPIEQINKARDSRVQNDASEVLSAYERYYAAKGEYPWNAYAGTPTIGAASAVGLRSDTFGFGICNLTALTEIPGDPADTCNPSGVQNLLISTGELKTAIIGRDEFEPGRSDSTKASQALWVLKAANADLIHICYIPKSVANRSDDTKRKCINTTTGVVSSIGAPCLGDVTDWNTPVVDGTEAMFKCIPE